MKPFSMLVGATLLCAAGVAAADTTEPRDAAAPVDATVTATPAPASGNLADLPKMKEEGKRLAALMERLQKETDPAERRKIMAEVMCPQ